MSKILKFIDFSFKKENYIALIVVILSSLWAICFHVEEIYENTIFENIAIIPLIISIVLCLKAKEHKILFRVLAMLFFLIIAREYNYGRVLFCAMPDNPHGFYPWSHYKYGYLAHVFVGIYIAIMALYGIINKIWIDIIDIIKKIPLPIWTFLFVLILAALQMYYEQVMHNTVVEEIAEFGVYCLVLALSMIYTKR